MAVPHAPWTLVGECIAALARRPSERRGPLPAPLQPLPGPAIVVAVRYSECPVGRYLELAVAEPARLGVRPGLCMTTMVVNSAEACVGGCVNWGFPKEVGTLTWDGDGDERTLRWAERGIVMRGRPTGLSSPILVPARALQRRSDGPVTVPARVRGKLRFGQVAIEVPSDDPLGHLRGPHRGA